MSHINKIVVINTLDNPTEAQDKISAGIDLIADATKITLGPYGRNVLLEKGLKATNDGITIAKEVQSKDEIEDISLRLVREAAVKTNDEAGDGTTTALTLAQAVYKECVRLLPGKALAGQKTVMQIRKEINEGIVFVVDELKKMAKPIESEHELIEVARVSSEDETLAKLIGTAQYDLGPEGTLLVEPTNDKEDSVEKVLGIRFDNGFPTSLVMNNLEKQRLEVEDVRVLMMNYTIENLKQIAKVLEALVNGGDKHIVIIARGFTDVAIKDCMENHKAGVMLYPINAPYLNQREVMMDLEAVIGGKYFDQEETALDSMTADDAGTATKVMAQRFSAIFTGADDKETKERVAARVKTLRDSHEGEESVFMEKNIEGRISQLTNGFALVKVGSISEADRKYKLDKAEDAVNTVKSALQEGTVPGAGMAYKSISDKMDKGHILKNPLLAPYNQIMKNAGETFPVEDWVRNSVKVERISFQNAAQVAVNLATSGGAIAKEFDKPVCHGK